MADDRAAAVEVVAERVLQEHDIRDLQTVIEDATALEHEYDEDDKIVSTTIEVTRASAVAAAERVYRIVENALARARR